MVRLAIRNFATALVATCPKCKTCSKLYRPTDPQIDSCGFESYSFHCGGCGIPLAGIIDPCDDELLVSLRDGDWCEHFSLPKRKGGRGRGGTSLFANAEKSIMTVRWAMKALETLRERLFQ